MFVNGTHLSPHESGAEYLLQGVHTTLKMHYNDTLDFLVIKSSNETIVRVSGGKAVTFSAAAVPVH